MGAAGHRALALHAANQTLQEFLCIFQDFQRPGLVDLFKMLHLRAAHCAAALLNFFLGKKYCFSKIM